jgi:LDH2 family malate/lactate/ureidoglycolate dehydrogenase
MEVLIQKAQSAGIAAVGIRNCNHIGRLGLYAEQAADADILSMVTLCGGGLGTSTTPYGGAGKALGSNPFAFGVPAGKEPPVILDFATTVVAGGKVAVAREKNERIPEGWIVDKDGRPTTDPNDFSKGGMLLTMAEYKGFGLSMVAEALGGALTGATQFAAGEAARNCVFMWGIRTNIFQPTEEYNRLEDRAIAKIKNTPPAPGFDEVLIPGERGRKNEAVREKEGIWIPEKTWETIRTLASELGIAEQLPAGKS